MGIAETCVFSAFSGCKPVGKTRFHSSLGGALGIGPTARFDAAEVDGGPRSRPLNASMRCSAAMPPHAA
jgi:hypothetical protein